MSQSTFKPRAYVKNGCPFSFKYLVFMAEAGLLGEIEIVRLRESAPDFAAIKKDLSAHLGKPATFPTVEVEPTHFMADSDRLIEHFASLYGQNVDDLPVLKFYKETIFPQLLEHHRETRGASA
jgi:glutathione S-transferase